MALIHFFFVFLHPMGRYLNILLLFLTILLGHPTTACAHDGIETEQEKQTENTIQAGKATGAVIANAQDLVRICNSRPQRIIPSHFGKPERYFSRLLLIRHVKQLKSPLAEWTQKAESAPFLPAVSCDYFVFALRRLLC